MAERTETSMDLALLLFCDYVESITGRKTYKRKANLPQIDEPYIVIQLTGFTPVAHDVSEHVWAEDKPTPPEPAEGEDPIVNTDDEIIRGLNILQFTVEALGGNAANVLARLQASYESEQFIFGMEAYGFGLSEKGESSNTSALLLDSGFENRWETKPAFYFNASEIFEAVWFNREKIKLLVESHNYECEWEGSANPHCKGGICESYKPE